MLHNVLKEEGVSESGMRVFGKMGISGGAGGADTFLSHLAGTADMATIQYFPSSGKKGYIQRFKQGKHEKGTGITYGTSVKGAIDREVGTPELLKNVPEIERASLHLNKNFPSGHVLDLQLRNVEVVKHSDKIYAVGHLVDASSPGKHHLPPAEKRWAASNKSLHNRAAHGGTGWTIAVAQQARKPIYLFDQGTKGWYKFDYRAPDGGKFRAIKETPELSMRPGLIGSRAKGLFKEGREAGRQLFAKAFPEKFPDVEPAKDSAIPGAVTEQQKVSVHPENLKQLKDYTSQLEKLDTEKTDIQDVINEGKIDKVRKKELQKELKNIDKQHKNIKTQIEKRLLLKEEDYIMSKDGLEFIATSRLDVDTGSAFTTVGVNALNFTKEHLKDVWDTPNASADI